MDVLTSSLQSDDSLRAAFASLDGASAEKRNGLGNDSYSHESSVRLGQARPLRMSANCTAQKQQWKAIGCRALSGGVTLMEMRKDVEDRAAAASAKGKKLAASTRGANQIAAREPSIAGPSFMGFPMSIEETRQEEEVNLSGEQRCENVVDNHERDDLPSPKRPRTLQWAAKRDKRIARRRRGPPLTRSQARQRQDEGEGGSGTFPPGGTTDKSTPLPSSNRSENETAEITDPSIGSVGAEPVQTSDAKQRKSGARKMKKKKKEVPILDLTFTEPVSNMEERLSSPLSSQTESESSIDRARTGKGRKRSSVAPLTGKPSEDPLASSDTEEEEEEEEEVLSKPPNNLTKHGLAARGTTRGTKSSKAAKIQGEPATIRVKKPSVGKGSPIFEGSTFLVLGFWAKVKLFEGLIQKHGGHVVKEEAFKGAKELCGSGCVIACTHSGCKPSNVEIEKWIAHLAKGNEQEKAKVETFFRKTEFIQAEWISECIARCLQRDKLLCKDKYLINTPT
ncbi:hypothetical protein CBS101457_003669 [Exobasidium rhododendri]|nr:hypothetical protein CBS101457_003669 [Exobasidium rhododendri]